jgi:hypothetical protein
LGEKEELLKELRAVE